MRHLTLHPRCARCGMKKVACICALLPAVQTRTHVAVVMHKVESDKPTNTGRLVAESLQNAKLHLYGNDLPALPHAIWPAGTTPYVLFPSAGAVPITALRKVERPALLVLDGTWHQANRLRKKLATQHLPFVAVDVPQPSAFLLRHGPHDAGASTIEAVAHALGALEGDDVRDALLRVLRIFQDRILWMRGSKKAADVEGGIPDALVQHTQGTDVVS